MSYKPRTICIVTGTRAEYGLLYWLMKEIQSDSDLELQIIATGMRLSPEFGFTYTEIEKDGFKIAKKVEMLLSSDTLVGITKSMGLGMIGFAEAYDELNPDIVILLGDRFETFSAAASAVTARVPIAHLHGGETTEGSDHSPTFKLIKWAYSIRSDSDRGTDLESDPAYADRYTLTVRRTVLEG